MAESLFFFEAWDAVVESNVGELRFGSLSSRRDRLPSASAPLRSRSKGCSSVWAKRICGLRFGFSFRRRYFASELTVPLQLRIKERREKKRVRNKEHKISRCSAPLSFVGGGHGGLFLPSFARLTPLSSITTNRFSPRSKFISTFTSTSLFMIFERMPQLTFFAIWQSTSGCLLLSMLSLFLKVRRFATSLSPSISLIGYSSFVIFCCYRSSLSNISLIPTYFAT